MIRSLTACDACANVMKLQNKCDKVAECVMLVLAGSCCDKAGDVETRDGEARDGEARDGEDAENVDDEAADGKAADDKDNKAADSEAGDGEASEEALSR